MTLPTEHPDRGAAVFAHLAAMLTGWRPAVPAARRPGWADPMRPVQRVVKWQQGVER